MVGVGCRCTFIWAVGGDGDGGVAGADGVVVVAALVEEDAEKRSADGDAAFGGGGATSAVEDA